MSDNPINTKKRGWKDKLLSSSIPLEFDAARLFREQGFWVDPEYSFNRIDEEGLNKEFSVDLVAQHYPLFEDPNNVRAVLEMPVECKFRTRNKRWVFLPEPVEDGSLIAHGIRVIDEFSGYDIKADAIRRFNCNAKLAYKGFEINSETGDVHDAELKHGINQLKYALPSLVVKHITTSILSHPSENHPLILCPILLTTASLNLLRENISISCIENSTSLDELIDEIPFLILRTSESKGFGSHVAKASMDLSEIEKEDWANIIKQRSKLDENGLPAWGSPAFLLKDLAKGTGKTGWFESFLICNIRALPSLIQQIKGAIDADAEKSEFRCPILSED